MGSVVINMFTRERINTDTGETEPIKPVPKPKTDTPESVKQMFRDSLDNERVKAKYNLKRE